MTATYQSFAGNSRNLGADPVVNLPSGTVAGDLLIAVCLASAGGWTPPAGWTEHASSLGGASPLYTKTATGSEPSTYTFVTTNATANSNAVIVRVSGQGGVDAAGGTSTSGNLVIPSVTSSGADRLLLQVVAKLANTTFTPPGGTTERFDSLITTQSYGAAAGDVVVGSGAAGSKTWVPSAGSGIGVGYALAIAPVPPQTVAPDSISATTALGQPTIAPGPVTVAPSSIASGTALGSPTVTAGPVTVAPGSVAPATAVGSPAVAPGPVIVTPAGVALDATVGAPIVATGPVLVAPSSIGPTSDVGTPTVLAAGSTIGPESIGPGTDLGTPTLVLGAVAISPVSIGPGTEVGTPGFAEVRDITYTATLLGPTVTGTFGDTGWRSGLNPPNTQATLEDA